MGYTSTITRTHKPLLALIQDHIQLLQEEYTHIKQTVESLSQVNSHKQLQEYLYSRLCSLSVRLEELHNLKRDSEISHHGQLSSNPQSLDASTNTNTTDAAIDKEDEGPGENTTDAAIDNVDEGPGEMVAHGSSFQERRLKGSEEICNHALPREKERYLCISDGVSIYCMDLKQCKDESDGYWSILQPLPNISTLNLLERGLPISMGLLQLGSDAYMVGGQELRYYKDRRLPDWIYKRLGFKGSSRKIYHLSLALVNDSLSLSECNNIPPLKEPKCWPIVEKIGDQIHVIETIPSRFPLPKMIPSHEVLNLNDLGRGWTKLSPMCYPKNEGLGMFISDHLVVGDRIYAMARGSTEEYLVFDSKANKWEVHVGRSSHSTKHVVDLFGVGKRICVREFHNRESMEPMYVVIGIDNIQAISGDEETKVITAVAYLVAATGKLICSQKLPHFFEGLKRPSLVREASIFPVNEEGGTVCAVVLGNAKGSTREFLFISTFTVEAVEDDDVEQPYGVLKDFVNVVLKDWYVYRDLQLKDGINASALRVSACFL